MAFTEQNYENAVLELFRQMGYCCEYGPEIERDFHSPLYREALEFSLTRLNPALPQDALNEALRLLTHIDSGTLLLRNAQFMDYLQNGITVKYIEQGEETSAIVYLADFENPERNTFHAVNQWTVIEYETKRADMVLFLNGLPVVVIELKSPSRENVEVSAAYRQLRKYMQVIPSLFTYNAICVMSDQALSKAGTITSSEERFMEWKTKDGSYENTQYAAFDTFFEGMFQKERLLDLIKNFLCFSGENTEQFKILAGYHQYFAVRKAVESTRHAVQTDGKCGVFWHTQGSGKSLSMVFYTHLLQQALQSPTVVVITDRNDLDGQLYSQFCRCADFLRQTPVQAQDRRHLKELLAGREANGIIFTTMQKFEESDEPLSERRNIIVVADEAHRGQYGLKEKLDAKTGKIKLGIARIIRNSLPKASYIGFTGTPISQKDRSTREVFGDYIDVYDMTQAVEDGATLPVYYESRVVHLKLDQTVLRLIDQEYDRIAASAESHAVEQSKRELSKMEAVLGADETIQSLVEDIIQHYESSRENLLSGKAMIVAYSRSIAIKIYQKMLELRPEWMQKVKVIMTSGNNDPEEWYSLIGNKAYREELAKRFKDNSDPLKIAIVVDMWLTGFDVPSLATMYIYRPMRGHNLMQAIARVNRVFQDKAGGLVVDYIGIASALKEAMNEYTVRDRKNYGNMDISATAYPKFLEKLEVCRDLFHGFDYHRFLDGTDLQRAKSITGGVNFLLAPAQTDNQKTFLKEAQLLKRALSLCGSMAKREDRLEAAFFESVRTMLTRFLNGPGTGKLSLKDLNDKVNELLKASIKSDGVINLFSDIKQDFSLFDPKFLNEIAGMKEKNLAVEMLKKLIAEQIFAYQRTSIVKSEKFSEIIQRTMNAYLNGMLTNEQVIEELMKLAGEISQAEQEGRALGLTAEELAFYDALTKPQAIKDLYEHDELIAITKELTENLRKSRTIDWQKKESARAGMRRMIKHLLKKHRYPPDEIPEAIVTVIRQCELWADTIE